MSRTENVKKNVFWVFFDQVILVILNLIGRKIFLDNLGEELLGVNSLFSDVLQLFSFADIGFGAAIFYYLYKPIAENDTEKIKSLLGYYRFIYRFVIFLLILVGVVFIPILPFLRTSLPIRQLLVYYLLFLLNNIISYFFIYREDYLRALQLQRKLSIVNACFSAIQILIQIAVVIFTKSYVLYVLTNTVILLVRKLVLNSYIKNKYKETRLAGAHTLQISEKKDIFVSAKSIVVHRLGNLAINQTDSLISSVFLDVRTWGLVSNYLVLKMAVSRLMDNIYSALLPSIGNLVATETNINQVKVFKIYDFLNYWFYLFCFVALGNLSSIFVRLYFGDQYALGELTVFFLFLAFYIDGLRAPISAMRETTGVFRVDQWYTIIAAVINLVVSIVLVRPLGVIGIYIGTICAMLFLHVTRIFIFMKRREGYNYISYYADIIMHIIMGIFVYVALSFIGNCISAVVSNPIAYFIIMLICNLLIPNLYMLLVYFCDKRFKEAILLLKSKNWMRRKERGE